MSFIAKEISADAPVSKMETSGAPRFQLSNTSRRMWRRTRRRVMVQEIEKQAEGEIRTLKERVRDLEEQLAKFYPAQRPAPVAP